MDLHRSVISRSLSVHVASWACAVVLLFSGGDPTYALGGAPARYCCQWTNEQDVESCRKTTTGNFCNEDASMCCSNSWGEVACDTNCNGVLHQPGQCNTETFVCDVISTPAVSEWGLVAMGLFVLAAAMLVFLRRRAAA